MKLNLTTAPAVQVGGSLTANVANYFDTPQDGTTRRWLVQAGPTVGAPGDGAHRESSRAAIRRATGI